MFQKSKNSIWVIALFVLITSGTTASNESSTDSISNFSNFKLSRIVLTGNGYFGFNFHSKSLFNDSTGLVTTSMPVGLMPIVLWKITPDLFFEGELDLMIEHGMFKAEIGYLNLSYNIDELGVLQVGKFLSPFGIFSERYHPFWINYSPNEPLGFSHGGFSPTVEIGACLRGGNSRINYALYVSKSPDMKDGGKSITDAGMIDFDTHLEFNDKIGAGGRMGILPFRNSSVEFGASCKIMKLQVGHGHDATPVAHTHSPSFDITTDAIAYMYAVDLTIQKVIPVIKGRIDVKSQANYSDAGTNNFIRKSSDGLTEIPYSFSNITQLGFIMISYKPILVQNNFLKNSGVFVRGGAMELPLGSLWYENSNEITAGLNYSFSWRNVLKLAYQQVWSTNKNYTNNNIMLQWAVAF